MKNVTYENVTCFDIFHLLDLNILLLQQLWVMMIICKFELLQQWLSWWLCSWLWSSLWLSSFSEGMSHRALFVRAEVDNFGFVSFVRYMLDNVLFWSGAECMNDTVNLWLPGMYNSHLTRRNFKGNVPFLQSYSIDYSQYAYVHSLCGISPICCYYYYLLSSSVTQVSLH